MPINFDAALFSQGLPMTTASMAVMSEISVSNVDVPTSVVTLANLARLVEMTVAETTSNAGASSEITYFAVNLPFLTKKYGHSESVEALTIGRISSNASHQAFFITFIFIVTYLKIVVYDINMKRVLLFLLLAACAYEPTGLRYAIDGDTIVLNNGTTIRLLGIDAPEKGDMLYDRAAYELQRRLVGRQLVFEGEEKDKYGRQLSFVFANGENVNIDLVQEGWARTFMHQGTKYEALIDKAQEEAIGERKGIWNIDDRSYQRLAGRCAEFRCPAGALAVASKYGDVFYNCGCSAVMVIVPENIICFTSLQDAIAKGFRETKKC